MESKTVADKVSHHRKETSKAAQEKLNKEYLQNCVPFWRFTDLDDPRNWLMLVVLRVVQALFMTKNMVHPDEYWQATQVAYNWVYGGVLLPWEWDQQFQLRNAIYPAYLAAPLYLLKVTGLDSPWLVRVQPYLTHCPLVILNDYFIWRIGKRLIGTDSTRIAVLLLVFNRCQNEYIVRCFTNGLEQIFSVIAFYFFLD